MQDYDQKGTQGVPDFLSAREPPHQGWKGERDSGEWRWSLSHRDRVRWLVSLSSDRSRDTCARLENLWRGGTPQLSQPGGRLAWWGQGQEQAANVAPH